MRKKRDRRKECDAGEEAHSQRAQAAVREVLRRALADSDQDELQQIRRELPHARERIASSYLYYAVLSAVFILGALAFVLGYVLDEGFAAAMLTELGGVLWTSVVVVLLLEIMVERLRGRVRQWIDVVEDRLRDHGLDISEQAQGDPLAPRSSGLNGFSPNSSVSSAGSTSADPGRARWWRRASDGAPDARLLVSVSPREETGYSALL